MRQEDWARYEEEASKVQATQFGPIPKTNSEKITQLRAEVDGLADRLKSELLAELRVEIERLITMEVEYANRRQ